MEQPHGGRRFYGLIMKKLNYDTVLMIVSVTYTATLLLVAIIALALTS